MACPFRDDSTVQVTAENLSSHAYAGLVLKTMKYQFLPFFMEFELFLVDFSQHLLTKCCPNLLNRVQN